MNVNVIKQTINRVLYAVLLIMAMHYALSSASAWVKNAAEVWATRRIYQIQQQIMEKRRAEAPDSLFVPDESAKPEYKAPEAWQ